MDLTIKTTPLGTRNAPSRSAAPAAKGDSFSPSAPADATLTAARQLRTQAVQSHQLSQVPTSLLPMGDSKYHAKAKIWIITKDLGEATAHRTDSEIDIHTTKGDATISDDPQNPNMVDISVPGNATKYQATLQPKNGGIIATTPDGKTVTIMPKNGEIDINASGFPQVPSSATIILTPES